MQIKHLAPAFVELELLARELVDLGEDENSQLMKNAFCIVNLMVWIAIRADTGKLSMQTALGLLDRLKNFQSDIFQARKAELTRR